PSPTAPPALPSFPTRRSSDLGAAPRGTQDHQDRHRFGELAGPLRAGAPSLGPDGPSEHREGIRRGTCRRDESVARPRSVLRDGIDRKSTRLNSSHVKISYAVF